MCPWQSLLSYKISTNINEYKCALRNLLATFSTYKVVFFKSKSISFRFSVNFTQSVKEEIFITAVFFNFTYYYNILIFRQICDNEYNSLSAIL